MTHVTTQKVKFNHNNFITPILSIHVVSVYSYMTRVLEPHTQNVYGLSVWFVRVTRGIIFKTIGI